jgi:hypothetical protein
MGNTYGTWLPGDARGFRTPQHRQHVNGDYKNPPPDGTYAGLHANARASLTRDPVHLSVPLRALALDEFLISFRKWHVEVAALSVGKVHFHILGRFVDNNPRRFVGLAKKESSAYLKQSGHAPPGGLWAQKCECVPIAETGHFWKTFGYILDHVKQGSAVWSDPNRKSPDGSFPDPDGLLID